MIRNFRKKRWKLGSEAETLPTPTWPPPSLSLFFSQKTKQQYKKTNLSLSLLISLPFPSPSPLHPYPTFSLSIYKIFTLSLSLSLSLSLLLQASIHEKLARIQEAKEREKYIGCEKKYSDDKSRLTFQKPSLNPTLLHIHFPYLGLPIHSLLVYTQTPT